MYKRYRHLTFLVQLSLQSELIFVENFTQKYIWIQEYKHRPFLEFSHYFHIPSSAIDCLFHSPEGKHRLFSHYLHSTLSQHTVC